MDISINVEKVQYLPFVHKADKRRNKQASLWNDSFQQLR